MAFDNSLFQYDAGYYQYPGPGGFWLAGKLVEGGGICYSQKAVDATVNVELDDSDVLIATYPKTGQTWALTILNNIFQAKELEEGKEPSVKNFLQTIPFIETEWTDGELGADKLAKLKSPRFMKTHLPYHLWRNQLEKHPNLKVIQTIRNPKDTLVSYYHHMRSDGCLGGFNGTWDQYFELFKEKKLPWGDFFEHTVDWFKFNDQRENSLVLIYEEGKKDPKGHVAKIAKFTGHNLSDNILDLIVEKSSVKAASKKFKELFKGFASWDSERSNFIRKGEVGDWVNYFSKEQSDYIDAKYKEYLEPLGLKFDQAM